MTRTALTRASRFAALASAQCYVGYVDILGFSRLGAPLALLRDGDHLGRHANVENVVGKLSAESQKRIAAAIPGELGKKLSGVAKDPEALAKDPTKALQQDPGGIGGGKTPKRVPRAR